MRGRTQTGLTLVEALVALALLGVATVAILPAFVTQTGSNERNELRAGAVGAVQWQLERLRSRDPATLPDTGTSNPQIFTLDGRDFEVTTHYCLDASLCDATTRHLTVEASYESQKIYDVETVFTALY